MNVLPPEAQRTGGEERNFDVYIELQKIFILNELTIRHLPDIPAGLQLAGFYFFQRIGVKC